MVGKQQQKKKQGGLNPSSSAFVPVSSNVNKTSGSNKQSSPPKKSATTAASAAAAKSSPMAAAAAATSKPTSTTTAAATTTSAAAKPPSPVKAGGAWGSKPLDAVRAAPPPSFASAAAAKPRPAAAKQPRQQSNGGNTKQQWNRNSSNNKNQRQRSGGGGGGGGGSRHGGRDRDHHHQHGGSGHGGGSHHGSKHHHHHHHHHKHDNSGGNWNRGGSNHGGGGGHNKVVLNVDLCVPGQGSTEAQKSVQRIVAQDLLEVRLQFLDAPQDWTCPEAPHWTAEDRVEAIYTLANANRKGGEVSQERRRSKKQVVETAPPLEECKPLQVNEETRWKAKVMNKDGDAPQEEQDTDEEVLKKSLLILNKLSLTKFDKLSDAFIDTGIGRNKACLEGAIGLIVTKAQQEPHFSEMYARLCFKLSKTEFHLEGMDESKSKKAFKKLLLTRCQQEFEEDQAHKIARATEGITDKEEQDYHASLVKKSYLGHMRFIGELYKGDMIKIEIMLFCLNKLLVGDSEQDDDENKEMDVDEERLECFAKLMTTIGGSLENQAVALNNAGKPGSLQQLNECWITVETMTGKRSREQKGPVVSNRVKFMLQDLCEMRDKGWVTRRKEETAKTIEQIHQEVAKEERKAARRSSSSGNLKAMGQRRASSGDVRLLDRRDSKQKLVDQDGFTQISGGRGSFNRSGSTPVLHRSASDVTGAAQSFRNANKPKRGSSIGHLERQPSVEKKAPKAEKVEKKKEEEPPKEPKVEYLSPDKCAEKAKGILKEYFVGGDTDDAVLSFDEMVCAGKEGSVERGGNAIESCVLMVMEMKDDEVTKALKVLTKCIEDGKLEKESIVLGLNDPLEFLSDIQVDAPLADKHLAKIVAQFVKMEALSFDFLLAAPEYFRMDGKPAHFGVRVIKQMGGDATDEQVEVVEKLMTADDKKEHPSARDLIAA